MSDKVDEVIFEVLNIPEADARDEHALMREAIRKALMAFIDEMEVAGHFVPAESKADWLDIPLYPDEPTPEAKQ